MTREKNFHDDTPYYPMIYARMNAVVNTTPFAQAEHYGVSFYTLENIVYS